MKHTVKYWDKKLLSLQRRHGSDAYGKKCQEHYARRAGMMQEFNSIYA